jgi:hypothetical protein
MASYREIKRIFLSDLNESLESAIIYVAGPEEDLIATPHVQPEEKKRKAKKDKKLRASLKKRLQREGEV